MFSQHGRHRLTSPGLTILGLTIPGLTIPGLIVVAAVALFSGHPSYATVHDVGVTTFEYQPAEITIEQGDSVRWYWIFGTHSVTEGQDCTVDDPLFRSEILPSVPEFIYQFNATGVYDYFCEPHCVIMNMKGRVTVLAPGGVPGPDGRGATFALRAEPNPTHGATVAHFVLPRSGSVRIEVVDSAGRIVRVLAPGHLAAEEHRIEWDGEDRNGRAVGPGVYFLRGVGEGFNASATVIVLR